jgi:hypothetical protein
MSATGGSFPHMHVLIDIVGYSATCRLSRLCASSVLLAVTLAGCGAAQPPVEVVTQQVPVAAEANHQAEGTTITYSTNPPTSGDHWPATAEWGVYNDAPDDERLVHNLEHGGVVIYYNPSLLDAPTVDQLKSLTRQLNSSRACTILTPRASLEDNQAIALTAWGWLATLNRYDEAAIQAFWNEHIAKGPEFEAGVCG